MKLKTTLALAVSMLLLALAPMTALADSITPDTVVATIGVGESFTVTKTVTVSEEPPTSAPVDVFFLTDSTGSMYGLINSVKTNAAAIMTAVAPLGDLAFGAGEYRDVGDTFVYRTNTDITTNTAAVQAGINMWAASGGGDWPEANLFALEQVAENASWRTGSTRILVWFGDAPGHDPRAGSTEASAIAALNTANVVVEALNVGSLDAYGQATRIAAATGGHYYPTVNTGAIVTVITDAITSVLDEYSAVSLDLSGVPVGITAVAVPAAYVGDYDRSVERTFAFDVTFTGDAAGVYDFNINALVDGGIVATERDSITVGEPVPEPATLLLLGGGLAGLAGCRRRKKTK